MRNRTTEPNEMKDVSVDHTQNFEERIDVLRSLYGSSFAAQFAGDLASIEFYFKTSQFVRHAIANLCWQGPGLRTNQPVDKSLGIEAWNLAREFELQARMTYSPPNAPLDLTRGATAFDDLVFMARYLTYLLRQMRNHAPQLRQTPPPDVLEVPGRESKMERYWSSSDRTRPLLALSAALRQTMPRGVTPLIFGSMAEPPPWPQYADVDLAFYLSNSVIDSATEMLGFFESLRKLAPLIYKIDPIHHHEPYILLETDCSQYSPAVLPLQTLRLATTFSDDPLVLKIFPLVESRRFSLQALARTHRELRRYRSRSFSFLDRYAAKNFLSVMLLLPALLCGCLGRPVDKRSSFVIFKAEMNADSVETIEMLERFRQEWHWTIFPPTQMLSIFGNKGIWLSRTVNRFPCLTTFTQLRHAAQRIDLLIDGILGRLELETRRGNNA